MVHITVLPDGVLQTLALQLDPQSADQLQSALRFLKLPHPRTGIPCLFLLHKSGNTSSPKEAILEVQMIDPPNSRSWFVGEEVIKDGKLLMMTPIDPAFLLIPFLTPLIPPAGKTANFRPADNIFEESVAKLVDASLVSSKKDPSMILSAGDLTTFSSLPCVQSALGRVCDVKQITEEITVYRYSLEKVVNLLKSKVERLLASKEFDVCRTVSRELAKDGLIEDDNEALLPAGRTRAACDLVAQYIPPDIKTALLAAYDFTALDAYLKAQAAANAPALDTNTKKTKGKAAKAAAAAEDKKRKPAKASHGVEKLKKADTKGMSKLSSYFGKTQTPA
ncbi:hypothetical protein HGRIS_002531 [Hohenbuehelia grisea]|uniref:Ribonuclease H2 subunit B n=1 Tax=Hohenbuehelia grisea TaxID=104357 RepID=A0ABR3JKU0_9AGAR